MSARLYVLRPFQSAVQQAQRAGIPREQAVHEVAAAQRQGDEGQHIAGHYRQLAWRAERGMPPTPPEAA